MNPIPEIELDGRRKAWRAVALRAIIAIALCLAASKPAAAQQKNETSLTTAQLEELLDKASALCEKYKTLFKDLTAEEKRVFEVYDKKTDKMEQRRRTESDLIVYASHPVSVFQSAEIGKRFSGRDVSQRAHHQRIWPIPPLRGQSASGERPQQ
jgi:hypothetical protein